MGEDAASQAKARGTSSHHHHHQHGYHEDKVEVVGEFGQGDSVGELEVLTYTKRQASIHAIRETELIKLPKTLFHALALRYPEITIQLSRIVAAKSATARSRANDVFVPEMSFARRKVKTVGILPVHESVPIEEFSLRLRENVEKLGTTLLLKNDFVVKLLGRHAFSPLGKLKLMNWLAEQEEVYDIVFYVADSPNSIWTQHCIRQVGGEIGLKYQFFKDVCALG